uniref:Uncharacterized protein n=1 Tax=Theileria annulata TaxID=5874 RepID=A0A3B0MM51_THEAN
MVLKKPSSKTNRKKITAKSVHNNFRINFFSQNIELSSAPDEEQAEKSKPGRKRLKKSSDSQKNNLVSILKKKGEYVKIKANSERFYQKLTNVTTSHDFSQLLIFDQDQLESISNTSEVDGISDLYFPVLNNTPTSSYGFVRVSPNSTFGPLINLGEGSLVLTFVQVEEERVYFESLNASKLGRAVCNSYSQALVIPNDVFIISNESSDITAKIFLVLSKVKWSNVDQVKRGKTVPLSQVT